MQTWLSTKEAEAFESDVIHLPIYIKASKTQFLSTKYYERKNQKTNLPTSSKC